MFGLVGAIPWPRPHTASVAPQPLRNADLQGLQVDGIELEGWPQGSKVILPAPGRSACSVSLFWPERRALCISDADWFGNLLFPSVSVRDTISSLTRLRDLVEAGLVDVLLPAHGRVKDGALQIASHLALRIRLLEKIRNEVLEAYQACGQETDVRTVTGVLIRESPLFRMLDLVTYPRMVVFPHSTVAACLREERLVEWRSEQTRTEAATGGVACTAGPGLTA